MAQHDGGPDSAEDRQHSEKRTPVVPDNGYSRESYAIHATRSELPLFSDALTGSRDDTGWLASLSGVFGRGEPGTAATAAESAIERRKRPDWDS